MNKRSRKHKKKTPSKNKTIQLIGTRKSKNVLKDFMDNLDVSLHGLHKCIRDIVIENYLGNGAFGSVHKIKYKESDSAIKIIPIAELETDEKIKWTEINPNIRFTTTSENFEKEVNMLKKLSKLGVCPKIKYHGFCMVNVNNKKKKINNRLKVGYIISELFNDTMWNYINKDILKLMKFINEQKFEIVNNNDEAQLKKNSQVELSIKKELESYIEKYEKIDEKLNEDLRIARQYEIYNNDSHNSNIMVKYDKKNNVAKIKIVDWGFSKSGINFHGLQKINTKKNFIGDLFDSLSRPIGSNLQLSDDIKNHLRKLNLIFGQIRWNDSHWCC